MFTLRQTIGALAMLAAPFASAAPLTTTSSDTTSASSNTIEVSHLAVHQPGGNSTQNTTISFVVNAGSDKAHCSGSWASTGAYPQDTYTACGNSSFGWNFEDGSFTSANQFTLQIEYNFEDDSIGDYPYNQILEFARANVTQSNLSCTTRRGARYCQQSNNSTIHASVWASIAK